MKHIAIFIVLSIMTISLFGQSWITGTPAKLYTSPIETVVGIGTSNPYGTNGEYKGTSRLDLRFEGSEKLTHGQRLNLMTKIEVDGNNLEGTFYGRMSDAATWHSGGVGRGVYGLVNLSHITTNYSECDVTGGRFGININNLSSFNSNKYYISGSYSILQGTSTSYPSNGIVSALIARDQIDNTNTWAGYFEGRVHFTNIVGIGTTSPDPNYKLSVNGKIRAKEVVVDTDWADFVFEDDYSLMSLAELEHFLKEHGHLPDIPTGAQVEEEGIGVGEMNAKLLQKIEE